jgi:hypothetical protein
MKKETWNKLKEEFPIILTAAAVSLLSYTLYYSKSETIFNTIRSAFYAITYSFIAIAIVYLILWIEYGVTNRGSRLVKTRRSRKL